jgi:drug/metabolite transporter (DMT)-like permease
VAIQPNRQDYGLLIALGAVWGSSFLLIKWAVQTIPPATVATGRIAIGAVVLLLIVAARGHPWPRTGRVWLLLVVMGLVGNVIPFTLINWGEVRIDSSLTAILMSTVPLVTILLAPALVRDEPITAGKIMGVVGPSALAGAHGELLGQIAVTFAAVCYALNGLVVRRLPQMPVEVISASALLCAMIIGLPLAFFVDQPWQLTPSLESLAALVCLGIVNTAGAYVLLFRLTMRAGAGFASFNNFLVPLFGVFWGALLLHEQLSWRMVAGLLLILAGLVAVRLWPSAQQPALRQG